MSCYTVSKDFKFWHPRRITDRSWLCWLEAGRLTLDWDTALFHCEAQTFFTHDAKKKKKKKSNYEINFEKSERPKPDLNLWR